MILDKKKNAIVTFIFLAGIILVFAASDLIRHDIGQERLGQVTSYLDALQNEKVKNGVYLAENGFYIEQHLPQDYPQAQQRESLQMLQRLIEDYPRTQVLLFPTADNILTEYLPWEAPYLEERALLEQIKEAVGREHVIDLFGLFEEHAAEGLYFRTDSRITPVAAYYVYQRWAQEAVSIRFRYRLEEMQVVTDSFLGDLAAQLRQNTEEKEALAVLPHVLRQKVSVTYDGEKKATSCVEESHLLTENPYAYFLDGDHGITVIDTGYGQGRVLFVLKDSNANVVLPLMVPHYERVVAVDLRYFTEDLQQLLEESSSYGDMDVLLMYGYDGFLEQFFYE